MLVDALQAQRIVGGDSNLAKELADSVELIDVKTGQTIIQQDGEDNDLYFIITGAFDIVVNATRIRQRGPGDSVGEMAAVEPIQRRSATVTAAEDSLVAKLTEAQLTDLASRYPDIWRRMAKELAKRLLERNRFVNAKRDKIRVFVISSAEAIPVARLLQDQFARETLINSAWRSSLTRPRAL
ncbi:hypothetical protein A8E08_03940 [Burkholderia cenocepacia]|nr:hypothetical protein A8E08_03940 [Burkholderia cenocepacia]